MRIELFLLRVDYFLLSLSRVQSRDNIGLIAELEVSGDQWSDREERRHKILGERKEEKFKTRQEERESVGVKFVISDNFMF